jgi:hypothetical protein
MDMNKAVVAAIMAAANAYMEQEEQTKLVPAIVTPISIASQWRAFGRQEAMRARSQWQARRRNR